MLDITRREFLKSAAAAGSLLCMSAVLPDCKSASKVAAGPQKGASPWQYGQLFGVSAEDCQKVLHEALKRGGDFAEIYFQNRANDGLSLEEGIVNDAWAVTDIGAGVRVVVGDQVGYAYTEELTLEALLNTAQTAALIASGAPVSGPEALKPVKVENRFPITYLPTEWPIAEKMALLRRMDKAARAASAKVEVVVCSIESTYDQVLIVRSDGLVAADFRPRISLNCSVSVRLGERVERNYYTIGGRTNQELFAGDAPERVAKEAVRRAEICLEAVTPPAGEMPLVLAPGESGILLHEAIGHALEADFNRKGISLFSDKIGQKVASDLCTIVDDGTIPNVDGSISVDDEGNPSHRTVLVEKGILKSYMHDRISANHYHVAPTGNGKRQSFRFQPIPRMTNTLLLNGPHSPEELFNGITRGIYAISFTNGSANIGQGDFVFYINYGYLIENGKLTSPIKDVNLVGNGPEILGRIDRVANNFAMPETASGYCGKSSAGGVQRVSVNFGLPAVRVSKITVGGRA